MFSFLISARTFRLDSIWLTSGFIYYDFEGQAAHYYDQKEGRYNAAANHCDFLHANTPGRITNPRGDLGEAKNYALPKSAPSRRKRLVKIKRSVENR